MKISRYLCPISVAKDDQGAAGGALFPYYKYDGGTARRRSEKVAGRPVRPGGTAGCADQSCQPIYCTKSSPSYSAFNAEWPESLQAGSSTAGTCAPGFSGTTARSCSLTGVWGTPSPTCVAIKCAAIGNDGAHSSWGKTQAGSNSFGTCLAGYEGAPTRACSITGRWEAVASPCTQKKCAAGTFSNSVWEKSLGNLTATGACVLGTAGSVTRTCSTDGVWGPISGACIGVLCPAETMDNAEWPQMPQGSTASGSCVTGYGPSPAPSRLCLASGVWDSIVGACVRLTCEAATFENADWPKENSMTDGVRGTCVAGWQGAPVRDCSVAGHYSTVSNRCTRITCPALEDATGSWTLANAGTSTVAGACRAGSYGTATRDCGVDGTWSAPTGYCVAHSCEPEYAGQVSWPTTSAGGSAGGSCETGYSGSPSRACSSVGEWEVIVNPCVQNVCPAVFDDHVAWPLTPSLSLPVEGVCESGFFGSPSRVCGDDGNWIAVVDPCAPLLCPAVLVGDANWLATSAGEETIGACIAGYKGTPRRQCLSLGAWGTISDPCTIQYPNCPSDTVGMTFFPSAEPGEVSIGNCATDFMNAAAVPPSRQCFANGTWEAEFSNPCALIPVDVSGTLSNLTWVSKTSTDVSLSWSAINMTVNTTFRVEVATGTGSFVVANNDGAVHLTATTLTVTNLFPNTLYLFRVSLGNERGYDEQSHWRSLSRRTSRRPLASSLTRPRPTR